MTLNVPQIGLQSGGGLVLGAVLGFTAKKLVKLAIVIGGVGYVVFTYLDYKGIYSVDMGLLNKFSAITYGEELGLIQSMLMDLLSVLPSGAGFVVGAMLGFKKG